LPVSRRTGVKNPTETEQKEFSRTQAKELLLLTEKEQPQGNFPDGINVHHISFYIPELDSKSILHLYVELFNGTGEDLTLSKIDGHIELVQETAGEHRKRGPMARPSFYDHSQNNVLKNHNFSFKISQEVHSKFAESWPLGNYVLDFRTLNIMVHPIGDPTRTARLPLWDAAVIARDGTTVRTSRRGYFDGQRKSWPPMSG
jgi:hypothetical protein